MNIDDCRKKYKIEHLNWLATHIDYLRRHKEYIKKSAILSKIVIDFLPLYTGAGMVSGAGFILCNDYKIYLGDLLDVWDAGFCYKGYPIVSCEIGIHWNTDYTIKYIKNKKIITIRKQAKGPFKYLPELPQKIFQKVCAANIAKQFPDILAYKNIELIMKIWK